MAWQTLKCCNTHDSLDLMRYWLEVFKTVEHDLVPQKASEQTCPLAIAFDQILPPEISDLSRRQIFDGIFWIQF